MGWANTCLSCGRASGDPLSWRCECGGALETRVETDYVRPARSGSTFQRFGPLYPYFGEADLVSLGESETPLVKTEVSSFKLEYLLPTGSFKDRGSCALISGIRRELSKKDVGRVKEDSSGNAGASIAAYSAMAGIKCDVYVPAAVSGPKALQIQMYGANLVRVPGSRADVTRAAQAETKGAVYIGHIWHPYFRDGMRTMAYELFEQMDRRLPEFVFFPVSAGTLLLGFVSGLQHLKSSGAVRELPRVVACQSLAVSPLYSKLRGREYVPPRPLETIADALVSTSPPLLDFMITKLKAVGGDSEVATEAEVLTAWKELARMGLYAEPSSAVALACLKKRRREGLAGRDSVVVLTGSGLKSNEEALRLGLR
jgi:threonine synthase